MRKYQVVLSIDLEENDILQSESIYAEDYQKSISEEEKEELRKAFVSSETAWASESFSGFNVISVTEVI